MKLKSTLTLGLLLNALFASSQVEISLSKDYGILPDRKENVAPEIARALDDIKQRYADESVIVTFDPGQYNFHPQGSTVREYYISNHDQINPKNVGIAVENWDNLTISAEGADFMFHGRMLPVAVIESKNCTLRGFSVDFAIPHITQVEILENESEGITFKAAEGYDVFVDTDGAFASRGEGWTVKPRSGIAFNRATGHLVYRTSDLWCPLDSVIAVPSSKNTFRAPKWNDKRLVPGTVVALRAWGRPAPGIFLNEDSATVISNVKVRYAEGMGLLAQLCDGITLDGFGVCLRGDNDQRYFTTQADATHFSGCKGLIKSVNGTYEGMMDDAINVHGTYLKVTDRIDDYTISARYMHSQSYGFKWGEPGDTVQIVRAQTMEMLPEKYTIESITPLQADGVKDFTIRFAQTLPQLDGEYGIENLTWTPEVYFADNLIRNNRARGSLFSTPRKTVVERNVFDHTSGSAILLCGDCMGWYETGACHDVVIRNNHFTNALTNQFQFTEAVISIYPEIHNLAGQKEYFHSGIVIENNVFRYFDNPLLYAKSTDGITFRNNEVTKTDDFAPYHPNRYNFRFQRCTNVDIRDNQLPEEPSILFE